MPDPTTLRPGLTVRHRTYGVGVVNTIDYNPLTGLPRQYVCRFVRGWGICLFRCWPDDLTVVPAVTAPAHPPTLRVVDAPMDAT